MLPFVDDKSDDVGTFISQWLGHQSYSPASDQALRSDLEKTCSPRQRAKIYTLGTSGPPGLLAIPNAKDAPARQKGRDGGWGQRAGDPVLAKEIDAPRSDLAGVARSVQGSIL
jgi:hypothetical protein